MKKTLSTLIIVFIALFAFGQAKQVIMACKVINITNATPKVFTLHFLNPFQKYSQSVTLNGNGEFTAKGEMLFTQNMTIAYNRNYINLYVHPGDSVHLTIDASLLDRPNFEWVTITGDGAIASAQVNLCHQYLVQLPLKNYNYSLAAAVILQNAKVDYEDRLINLHAYAQKNNLLPEVVQWAQCDIKYTLSNQLSEYMEADSSASNKIERIKLFTDPFFETYDPANFESMMFAPHLANYAYHLANADAVFALALKQNNFIGAIHRGVSLLLKEPAGVCRDYMMYNFLIYYIEKHPTITDQIKDSKKYFTRTIYYDHFKQSVTVLGNTSFRPTNISGVSYLTAAGTTETIPPGDIYNYLAKRHPGKAIYVDVYATWCAPCLREIMLAPQLHKTFKEKDVVFVNLCLQSNTSDWQKLVKKYNLEGENYFFTADAGKIFMDTFRLKSFPSYMLTNKKGKIVTNNAPRPSEKNALKDAITKQLNQ